VPTRRTSEQAFASSLSRCLSQRPSYHHAKKLDCTSALEYYLDTDCLRAISRYESDHRTTSHCRGRAESS